MSDYRRPEVSPVVFQDAAGEEIPYGSRWKDGIPPEDSYSVTSNLDRFRPIQTVTDALIDWLSVTYEARVEENRAFASDALRERSDVTRAIRVTPSSERAAPLTFVYTSFPSVIVHAGALHDFFFPWCGCDACDEDWQGTADELEWTVRTVVRGGYEERVDLHRELGLHHALDEPGVQSSSGETSTEGVPSDRLERAVGILPDGPWAPWALRRSRRS